MNKQVIQINNLGKRYRIGGDDVAADTLVGTLIDTIRRPIRNLRNLRKLTDFSSDDADDAIIWALRDVSFEVDQGEVVGIIGANGAGKSTLLKILSRITAPTTGRIEIEGRISSLLEVGTGFHPELTGAENVYLNGTILGMTKKEIDLKYDEIIEFAGVGKFVNTPIKRYSTGMHARLAFAVAAFLEPEVLLVDEVLSVGDASFRNKSYARMQNIARGGRTVLFVSHNLEAIRTICTRAIFFEAGQVLMDGDPVTVVNHYLERLSQQAKYELVATDNEVSAGVSLNRVVLRDWAGNPRTEFGPDDGVEIMVDYTVDVSWDSFLVRLRVFAEDGTNLLTSGSNQTADVESGRYIAVCRIPPRLLNHGHYDVNLWARHGGQHTMFVKRGQLFFFIRHPIDKARKNSIMPGVLDPEVASWHVSRVEAIGDDADRVAETGR